MPFAAFVPRGLTFALLLRFANSSCARANVVVSKPVNIGDRVWIAADVKIVQGVTIGNDSIIGAGSIVTHDIPANVIAAGNPCRVIRQITEQDKWLT